MREPSDALTKCMDTDDICATCTRSENKVQSGNVTKVATWHRWRRGTGGKVEVTLPPSVRTSMSVHTTPPRKSLVVRYDRGKHKRKFGAFVIHHLGVFDSVDDAYDACTVQQPMTTKDEFTPAGTCHEGIKLKMSDDDVKKRVKEVKLVKSNGDFVCGICYAKCPHAGGDQNSRSNRKNWKKKHVMDVHMEGRMN